jgi:hypothetical protein
MSSDAVAQAQQYPAVKLAEARAWRNELARVLADVALEYSMDCYRTDDDPDPRRLARDLADVLEREGI